MLKPRRLRPGDRVAVIAPGSHFTRDEFDRGVAEIRRLGFEPVYSEAVFERGVFTAGSPQVRAEAFVRAWSDPGVAALIAVRGGYGSVQTLRILESLRPMSAPKLFIGYSDTTSILTWLTCQCGVTALHGPMLDARLSRGSAGYDERSFRALLEGGSGLRLAPDGLSVLRDGDVSGPLFGGTITQLTGSLGTPNAFNPPQGSVLFLEDVNERPYKLHRLLTHLRLAGILSRARALVFGEMRGCDEPDGAVSALDVIRDITLDFPGPVIVGFPSGHTTGPCWTLPLGVMVRITTQPHPEVIIEESPVE